MKVTLSGDYTPANLGHCDGGLMLRNNSETIPALRVCLREVRMGRGMNKTGWIGSNLA